MVAEIRDFLCVGVNVGSLGIKYAKEVENKTCTAQEKTEVRDILKKRCFSNLMQVVSVTAFSKPM